VSARRIICETCDAELTECPQARCDDCPGRFSFEYEARSLPEHPGGFWDFAALLPVAPEAAVSLGEGATPLLPARLDGARLFLKLESQNPTGSQKDRALALAVAKAKESGARRVVIASTGSAGLSCAAYCARAELPCVVIVPMGTPPERLAPMRLFGAVIVEFQGTFVEIEALLERLKSHGGWYDATTKRRSNPYQAEAPKTIA
jgi:threonine synthase